MHKPGDSYVKEFVTSDPATGAAANATSLPVATANHNGSDDSSFVLTVANIDAGRYKITGTVPNGYARGDSVNVTVAATCGGVAGKAVVDTFVIDSKRIGDLADFAGGAVSTVTDKAGYSLAASGLDAIPIETGINARQALSPILAACGGVLAGAATTAVAIAAAGNPSTARINAVVDTDGNRTAVTLHLPT